MPRQRTNGLASINLLTGTEVVLATLTVPSAPAGAFIDFDAVVVITSSATAGVVTVKIERGSAPPGTATVAQAQVNFGASVAIAVPLLGTDSQALDVAGQPYIVTGLQSTGTTYTCGVQSIQAVW